MPSILNCGTGSWSHPIVNDKLPRFVRTCRTLQEFWSFIKRKDDTYAGRRRFLSEQFDDVLTFLEQQAATPGDTSVSHSLGVSCSIGPILSGGGISAIFRRGWAWADQPACYPGLCREIAAAVRRLNPAGLAQANPLPEKQLTLLARLLPQPARGKLVSFWKLWQVPPLCHPSMEGVTPETPHFDKFAWLGDREVRKARERRLPRR